MDLLLANVAPPPTSKLDLTGNLGTAFGAQLDALRTAALTTAATAAAAAAARAESVALVNALAAEIASAANPANSDTDDNLRLAIRTAYAYGKAITGGNIADIGTRRGRDTDAAIRRIVDAAGGGGGALVTRTDNAATAAVAAASAADWSNIKWLALAIAMNTIATAAITAGDAAQKAKMNIRLISHVIAFGNNSGLLPDAAINLQNLLNGTGIAAATSILGNPSATDLHNTIVAKLSEANVESLTGLLGKSVLTYLRETFTGKLSVYDPYTLSGPVVNPESLDFDRFLPADVLQAVLENRQKKFFPMARVNISPSWFGLFAPGNQLRFEQVLTGGASLDPNMPIEMRGRGSAVYGSAIKGGDYNNWQVVGKNAFISDKLDFALQTAIKSLGTRLTDAAKVEIQGLITTLKEAERKAKEAAENLKTVIKANQATKLTGDIADVGELKKVADEYNARIGKVAKVEGKLGRVLFAITAVPR
jgi:hypothetical protein